MKFEIERKVLLENLNYVAHALSGKNILPVLRGIKFTINKNELVLLASDNDITIEAKIPIEKDNINVEKEGNFVIEGKYIFDIVKKIDEKVISFEVDSNNKIIIKTSKSIYKLNGFNNSEYPNIDLELNDNKISLNSKLLKNIYEEINFSTSTDEGLPVLTGINLKLNTNILECNTTNSFRLSQKIIDTQLKDVKDFNIIIPNKNMKEFVNILDDSDIEVDIYVFNTKVIFKYKNIIFQTRLINGNYPEINNLIPKEFNIEIELNAIDFYNAIDRASILASDKEKNIVNLNLNANKMKIKASQEEVGLIEEELNVNNISNNNIDISFNARYMMDAIKSFKEDTIMIKFVDNMKPIVLTKKDDDSLTQLVLPIRTY